MTTDTLGNKTAREGVDRCYCGSKYWENDRCVDCNTHVTRSETADEERELFQDEYEKFTHSPDWELRNVEKALNVMPFFNGPREEARLKAVKQIRAERRKR